jgi:UDP-glucose 4-epimerase
MKKVLVTGGAGYIGTHTVVELLNKDYEVILADNFVNSNKEVLKRIETITGKIPVTEIIDLCELDKVQQLFKLHKNIEYIIHFAAYKAVGESVEDPLKYYNNNLISLLNILSVSKSTPSVKGIVFSSSCTVYGQPEILPVTESTVWQAAESPYGYTKQVCEEILKNTIPKTHFQCISLRYFNPIGAHTSALIGELPNGVPNNLVPYITQTAIGKREKLTIFGNDYNTNDGTCLRDFIHVVDLANAHIKAIEYLHKNEKVKYDVFNIGTGNGNTVLETVLAFEKANNLKLNYSIGDRRSGDVEKIYADCSKAKKLLNWSCEYSLEKAMETAWQWELSLKNNPL